MRSVSLRLVDLERNPLIPLGFEGENEYTVVRIDCKKVFDEHPNAVPTWAVTPPKGDSYPVVVVRDGDIVSWTVCDSDLMYPGTGKFQLAFVIDETIIGKTYTARTKILDSITPSGEAPTPIQNWLTQAAAALQALPHEVSDAVVALMGAMVGVGQTLNPGENVTVSYDAENNTLTIGVPRGADGQDGQDGHDGRDGVDGHTPVITAQKVGKVTTFYVDGVAIATVNDGQDGVGIDDTTKSTTSTWSSKKIDDENSALKTEINSKYTKPQTGIPATDMEQAVQTSLGKADSAYQKPQTGIPASDLESGVIPSVPVTDIKRAGVSIVNNGSADVAPVVDVTGSTPSITGVDGTRYICGECATLSITAPASGIIDVVFESGSTATVLTVSSAKTGVTAIKWANGFDPTALEANTTYEINILDGEFGVVGSWT